MPTIPWAEFFDRIPPPDWDEMAEGVEDSHALELLRLGEQYDLEVESAEQRALRRLKRLREHQKVYDHRLRRLRRRLVR